MNLNELKFPIALVSGASKGIGAAVAKGLAEDGFKVILIARSIEGLEKVRKALPQPDFHLSLSIDLNHPENIQGILNPIIEKFGPVHTLVINSGGPPPGPLTEVEPQDFIQAFTHHLFSAQILFKTLLPGMKTLGSGRILTITSTSVKAPIPNLGVSNTVRGAMSSWVKTLSRELAPFNITVNNILPGATQTERLTGLIEKEVSENHSTLQEVEKKWLAQIPLGRFARPEEIAHAVCFLASPKGAYITGINLPVDGGRTPSL